MCPYITQKKRKVVDPIIDELVSVIRDEALKAQSSYMEGEALKQLKLFNEKNEQNYRSSVRSVFPA